MNVNMERIVWDAIAVDEVVPGRRQHFELPIEKFLIFDHTWEVREYMLDITDTNLHWAWVACRRNMRKYET